MKITIEQTDKIVEVNGVPARIWEGKSENGQDVICLITRLAVPSDQDCTAFERELRETEIPHSFEAYPSRMLL